MQSSRLSNAMSEKYRIVPRTKDTVADGEIRVCSMGSIPRYVDYTQRLFNEKNQESVVIKATGGAIPSAINVAENLKRRLQKLHQLNVIGVSRTVDTFEPTEIGLDKISYERDVPYIEITLTKNASLVDTKAPGYQIPLDPSEINNESQIDNSEIRSGRGSIRETDQDRIFRYQPRGGYRRGGGYRGASTYRGNSYRGVTSSRGGYRRVTNYRGRGGSYREVDGGYRSREDTGYRGRGSGYRGGRIDGGYRGGRGDGGYRGGNGDGSFKRDGGYRTRGGAGLRGASYNSGISRGGTSQTGRGRGFARPYREPVRGGPRGRGGPKLLYEPKSTTTS